MWGRGGAGQGRAYGGRLGVLSLEPLRPKRARYQPSRNRPTAHGPAPAPASPAMRTGSSPTRRTFRLERPFTRHTQRTAHSVQQEWSIRVCERLASFVCSCAMRPCCGCHSCRALAPMLRHRLSLAQPRRDAPTDRPTRRATVRRACASFVDCMRCDGLLLHCGRDVPARRFVRARALSGEVKGSGPRSRRRSRVGARVGIGART